jgi:hypothetical protein
VSDCCCCCADVSYVDGYSQSTRPAIVTGVLIESSPRFTAIACSYYSQLLPLTTDIKSPLLREIPSHWMSLNSNKYGIEVIAGSYATEIGLRAAFERQELCYCK